MANNLDGIIESAEEALLPNAAPAAGSGTPVSWDMRKGLSSTLGAILAALIACFAVFTKYSDANDTAESYMYLMHVSIMIFVGFGFLMTFLKSYSLSAVSLNLVASCVMLLATVLVVCLPSLSLAIPQIRAAFSCAAAPWLRMHSRSHS